MKKLLVVIAVLLLGAGPSHAQKTKTQISSEITTLFPDNTSGQITPLGLRTVTNDLAISIMPTAPVTSGNLACFDGTTGLLKDCGSAPTANAITALTGDVTATGPGSVAATLATAQPGAHTWALGQTFSSAITYGGVTLSNAVSGTGNMVLSAGPTFTGTVNMATLNMTGALAVTSNSASALAVGLNGATNPALQIDASAALSVTGLKIASGASGAGLDMRVVSSATNEGLGINAKGSGVINIGSVSTGIVTITPNVTHSGTTTLSAALTYGGVTLNNGTTGTGNLVASTSPTLAGTINISSLTASTSLALDGSKNLVSVTNTGSGNNVLATSPTLVTPVLGAATATTINGVTIDNSAWTSYSPTVTSSINTITTLGTVAARSKQIGKTVFVEADVTITTAGTGAGLLQVTLPTTAAAFPYVGSAREVVGTGKSGAAYIAASATTMVANDASATTFIANGARVIFTATYEIP